MQHNELTESSSYVLFICIINHQAMKLLVSQFILSL